MFTLRLLGGAALEGDREPVTGRAGHPRRLALLALVASAPRGTSSREKLIAYLWPDSDTEQGRHLLKESLYVLRRALGGDALLSEGDNVRLDPERISSDLMEFEAALERGDLERAVRLYAGPFLDGFFLKGAPEFERWVETERRRLADAYAKALEALAERAESASQHTVAAEWWKRLAAHDPYNSRVVLRLMQALAAAGDPANALEYARVHELRMREELGIEPPEDLRAYAERLRKEPVQVSKAVGVPTPVESRVTPTEMVARPTEGATGIRRIVHEIHRRSLWQVLFVYCGGALIGHEALQALTEGLGLPDWFPALAVVAFIILLPVVLATAFVQEGMGGRRSLERALYPPVEPEEAEVIAHPVEREAWGVHRIFTWRNAVLAGVGAFALLGLGTAAYMGMRVMGIGPVGTLIARGVLDERDEIILAEFENHTSDSLLALAVTEAFRTDLSQSRVLRVAEPRYVRQVLIRMEREPDARLDSELACEVAVREGMSAVITGDVSSVGTGYVLSARLLTPESGEIVAGWREAADDSTGLIPAIDRLSKQVRERVGESLKGIRRSEPLAQVTTGSLEALRRYSQASKHFRQGRSDRAIPLYQEAIALDSGFAAAWRGLGVQHYSHVSRGERAQAVEAMTRAYELRDRLTERERYGTIGLYHLIVDGDVGQAMNAYRTLVEISDSTEGLHNLAAIYSHLRDCERAEELYRRALLEADSSPSLQLWFNLFEIQVKQGKLDEARRTGELWAGEVPGIHFHHGWLADLAVYRGDYAAAEAHIQALAATGESRDERLSAQDWGSFMRGNLAWYRGQLADARGHFADAVATAEKRGATQDLFQYATFLGLLHASFLAGPGTGIQTVEDVLERHPLSELPALDRPYLNLARFYALVDRPDRARDMLDEYERTVEPRLRSWWERPQYYRVAGAVALAEGRLQEAIALMRQGDEGEDPICGLPLLGRAYDLAGDADSALAVYERFVTLPHPGRTLRDMQRGGLDGFWLVPICERLAVLYEQRGDVGRAVHYYGRVVELWQDADPELQPRVEAARRAIEALAPNR